MINNFNSIGSNVLCEAGLDDSTGLEYYCVGDGNVDYALCSALHKSFRLFFIFPVPNYTVSTHNLDE